MDGAPSVGPPAGDPANVVLSFDTIYADFREQLLSISLPAANIDALSDAATPLDPLLPNRAESVGTSTGSYSSDQGLVAPPPGGKDPYQDISVVEVLGGWVLHPSLRKPLEQLLSSVLGGKVLPTLGRLINSLELVDASEDLRGAYIMGAYPRRGSSELDEFLSGKFALTLRASAWNLQGRDVRTFTPLTSGRHSDDVRSPVFELLGGGVDETLRRYDAFRRGAVKSFRLFSEMVCRDYLIRCIRKASWATVCVFDQMRLLGYSGAIHERPWGRMFMDRFWGVWEDTMEKEMKFLTLYVVAKKLTDLRSVLPKRPDSIPDCHHFLRGGAYAFFESRCYVLKEVRGDTEKTDVSLQFLQATLSMKKAFPPVSDRWVNQELAEWKLGVTQDSPVFPTGSRWLRYCDHVDAIVRLMFPTGTEYHASLDVPSIKASIESSRKNFGTFGHLRRFVLEIHGMAYWIHRVSTTSISTSEALSLLDMCFSSADRLSEPVPAVPSTWHDGLSERWLRSNYPEIPDDLWSFYVKEGLLRVRRLAVFDRPIEPLISEPNIDSLRSVREIFCWEDGAMNLALQLEMVEGLWNKIPVIPVGLKEPFKVRVISTSKGVLYHSTRVFQRITHRGLQNLPEFRLTKDERADIPTVVNQILGGIPRLGRDSTRTLQFLSGDWVGSTNNIIPEASTRICQAICERLQIPSEIAHLYERSLTGHFIPLSGRRVATRPELDLSNGVSSFWTAVLEGSEAPRFQQPGVDQTWGQFMGAITSFPVLCIANLAIACVALNEAERDLSQRPDDPKWLGRRVPGDSGCVANGDDFLTLTTPKGAELWGEVSSEFGLKPSPGKSYESSDVGQVNSAMQAPYRRCPDLSVDARMVTPHYGFIGPWFLMDTVHWYQHPLPLEVDWFLGFRWCAPVRDNPGSSLNHGLYTVDEAQEITSAWNPFTGVETELSELPSEYYDNVRLVSDLSTWFTRSARFPDAPENFGLYEVPYPNLSTFHGSLRSDGDGFRPMSRGEFALEAPGLHRQFLHRYIGEERDRLSSLWLKHWLPYLESFDRINWFVPRELGGFGLELTDLTRFSMTSEQEVLAAWLRDHATADSYRLSKVKWDDPFRLTTVHQDSQSILSELVDAGYLEYDWIDPYEVNPVDDLEGLLECSLYYSGSTSGTHRTYESSFTPCSAMALPMSILPGSLSGGPLDRAGRLRSVLGSGHLGQQFAGDLDPIVASLLIPEGGQLYMDPAGSIFTLVQETPEARSLFRWGTVSFNPAMIARGGVSYLSCRVGHDKEPEPSRECPFPEPNPDLKGKLLAYSSRNFGCQTFFDREKSLQEFNWERGMASLRRKAQTSRRMTADQIWGGSQYATSLVWQPRRVGLRLSPRCELSFLARRPRVSARTLGTDSDSRPIGAWYGTPCVPFHPFSFQRRNRRDGVPMSSLSMMRGGYLNYPPNPVSMTSGIISYGVPRFSSPVRGSFFVDFTYVRPLSGPAPVVGLHREPRWVDDVSSYFASEFDVFDPEPGIPDIFREWWSSLEDASSLLNDQGDLSVTH